VPPARLNRTLAIAAGLGALALLAPVVAAALDQDDLLKAWRKKDRAIYDYGQALRKIPRPTAEDRERLRNQIVVPATAEYERTMTDFNQQEREKIRQKAAKIERDLNKKLQAELSSSEGERVTPSSKVKAAAKGGARTGPTAPTGPRAEAAAKPPALAPGTVKTAAERPGVPNLWERAPRKEVVVDPEGIPEELIFGKGRGGAAPKPGPAPEK